MTFTIDIPIWICTLAKVAFYIVIVTLSLILILGSSDQILNRILPKIFRSIGIYAIVLRVVIRWGRKSHRKADNGNWLYKYLLK